MPGTVNEGAVVSRTVTVNVCTGDLLPAPSTAYTVTAVVPNGSSEPLLMEKTSNTGPTASVALAVKVT